MKYFVCDECLDEKTGELQIHLKGYFPTGRAGILLPESFKELDFCSHDCFVEYMREALTQEPR